jgi:hypothetical protein
VSQPLKRDPNHLNEVHDLLEFRDAGRCQLIPVAQFEPSVAMSVVTALSQIVRKAHAAEHTRIPNDQGIVRAQTFEEGEVYMLATPFEGYFADRYLMDFYDVRDRGVCSRMHFHTGLRFVRMMTGPDTRIRVSSLSPFHVTHVKGVSPNILQLFSDQIPHPSDAPQATRYNAIVPENSWVDMQIPRGVSHQFNAVGPNAMIDSVHPEESIEVLREQMSGYTMMAQTIFLASELPDANTCILDYRSE